MKRRDDGLFRGSEFPRLLVLLGLVVIGWPLAVYFAWPRPEPPEPSTVAQLAPLPPPDPSPELQGILDKKPLTLRDSAGYALLLKRAREVPSAELARQSRREVLFSQLIDDPERYRGLPIHLDGTILRVLKNDGIDPKFTPTGVLYEAYLVTPDSQRYPSILIFEDPPATIPVGDNLTERVSFEGYFLKLKQYEAGDGVLRVAPMLVGRIGHASAPSVAANASNTRLLWTLSPLLVLFCYAVVRWAFHMRRVLAPSRSSTAKPSPVEEIDPGVLASWVERAADDEDDEPDWRSGAAERG